MPARSPDLLRNLLLLDAATCAAMGVLLTIGARAIATRTQIPQALLFYAGVVLFPVAAYMVVVARRGLDSPRAVQPVLAGNVLWIAASLLLIVSGWIAPNAIGTAFIGVQAAAVAVLTALEGVAWRRVQRGVGAPLASSAGPL